MSADDSSDDDLLCKNVRCGDDGEPPDELAEALAEVAASTPGSSSVQPQALQELVGGKPLLHWAIQVGQPIAVIATALRLGASVTQKDAGGNTPLHLAVLKNDPEIIRLLTQHGADVNAADNRGLTPLHWAVQRSFASSGRTLLELGADPHRRCSDSKATTPILMAASRPDASSLLQMMKSLGVDLNGRDAQGKTPLVTATANGCLSEVRCLLAAGSEPNVADASGQTPIQIAAQRADSKEYAILFDAVHRVSGGV